MIRPPVEATRVSPKERFGPTYKTWYELLASSSAVPTQERKKLQEYLEKKAAGTPTTPAEEAAKDAAIDVVGNVVDTVKNVVSGAPGATLPDQRAVSGLPDFVQNIFADPALSFPAGTPHTDAEAARALLAQTLLTHTIKNPDMDIPDVVTDLADSLYAMRSLDEALAAEMLSGVADEAMAHGISLDPALEEAIDDFLEAKGKEKVFENRANQPAPPQTPLHFRSLGEVYAHINTELAGQENDPHYWEVYTQRLLGVITASEANGRLLDGKAAQLFSALGGVLSNREKVLLLSMSDPVAFAGFYESYMKDPELVTRVQAEYPGITGAQLQRRVAMKASEGMTEFSMKMVMEIFAGVLSEDPKDEFAKKAAGTGAPEDNMMFRASIFEELIKKFRISAGYIEDRSTMLNNIALYGRVENEVSLKDKASGEVRPYTLPSTREKEMSVSQFADYMLGVFESGKGVVEYGYNFRFSIEKGQGKIEEGRVNPFYGQIAGFADQALPSVRLDTIYRLPGAEMIQAAAMKYQSKMMRLLYDHGNRYTSELMAADLVSNDSAIEKEIRAELAAQFGSVEDWKLQWAFNMARAEFVGVAFGFHETLSFVDPDLDESGDPTGDSTKGYGHKGIFNSYSGAIADNRNPYITVNGAVFCPYTIDWRMREWDFQKYTQEGEGRWRDTFKVGQAAYDGTILEGQKLFIDLGGTMVEAGGVFTFGGAALQKMYEGWIIGELSALQNPKLDTKSADSIINGWKKIENIGIDVVRNYVNQLVIGGLPSGIEAKGSPKVEVLTQLGDFLFSRYFGELNAANPTASSNTLNPLAKALLSQYGVKDRQGFRNFLTAVATSRDYDGMQREVLQEVFKAVEVAMVYEQMPSYFILMEKKRDTEYGVTLGSIIEARLGNEFSAANSVAAHALFKEAMADLAFVEQQGRLESMQEMDRNLEDHGNLFGDLSRTRSLVRNGRGNIIDETYIRDSLKARFGYSSLSGAEQAAADQKIEQTVSLWKHIGREITTEVTDKNIIPNSRHADSQVLGNKDIAKLSKKRRDAILKKAREGGYRNRATWMQNMLVENKFGHSFTSQAIAMQYLRFQGAGENVVRETAVKVGLSAESISLKVADLPNVVRGIMGTGNTKPVEEAMGEFLKFIGFKGMIRAKGMNPEVLVNRMIQQVTIVFKEDDKVANSMVERASRSAVNAPKAIIDALNGKPVVTWDIVTMRKVADFLSHRDVGLLKDKAEGKDQKWRTVKVRDKSLLGKIPGVQQVAKRIRVRDWANEASAEAFNNYMRSDERTMGQRVYLPLMFLFLFIMGLIAGKEGMKDIKIT